MKMSLTAYPQFFKKCGEITISSDKKCFGLNCLFCNGICLQMDIFLKHIREEHDKDIEVLYAGQIDKQPIFSESASASQIKKSSSESTWSEVTTTTATNTVTTLATLLSGVDFDLEMGDLRPEEAAELQELVFIMEDNSNSVLNMMEEETIEPFQTNETTTKTLENVKGCDEESQHNKNFKADQENNCSNDSQQENHDDTQFLLHTEMPALTLIPTRRVEHNREVIIYLLEAYQKNAKLWDPNHPNYKYNAQRSIFNELAAPLARDMNVTLTGAEIFNILNGLRSRYRRELTKMTLEKGNKKSKLWYFERMNFLRDVIENKRAERETKNRVKNSKSAETLSNNDVNGIDKPTKTVQSKSTLTFLLDAYKSREALWNPEHSDFSICDKQKLFKEISSSLLVENEIKLPSNVCKIEIDKLITRYRKELNALNRRKGLHVPKLWCFDQMEFLRNVFEMELQNRKRRKKGVIISKLKAQFIKANDIVFETIEDHLRFIEIYKAHPALWLCEHPDYRSVKYREEATKSLLAQFNETFKMNVTIEEIEKTIYTLRKSFALEKQKVLNSLPTSNNMNSDDTNESNISSSSSVLNNSNAMPSELYAYLADFLTPNLGPFRCNICQMIIKTYDQYQMHKSAHDGTMPFVCILCSKGFQVPGNLAIHIRRHKRDLPYSCEQCTKSFATSTEVTIHQRVHTGARPYICDLCGKTFKTWSFFDIHRRVHLKQSTFLCPICDKGFYEKNRYTAHMNGHLNIRKHSCKVCEKSFTTFANLKKHNELHLPVRKYKCDICSMRYAQFASLRWHKRRAHSCAIETESMEQ